MKVRDLLKKYEGWFDAVNYAYPDKDDIRHFDLEWLKLEDVEDLINGTVWKELAESEVDWYILIENEDDLEELDFLGYDVDDDGNIVGIPKSFIKRTVSEDGYAILYFEVLRKEVQILMAAGYTEDVAKRELESCTKIFDADDFEKYFDYYSAEFGFDEETIQLFKMIKEEKIPTGDWSIIEYDGRTYCYRTYFGFDEETIRKFKMKIEYNMPTGDWIIVEYDGKTYYIWRNWNSNY